jgi:phage protein U
MLALGMFVFMLPTVAYETKNRHTSWRHPSNPRIGAMPAYQYVGKGDDVFTLGGKLLPELYGSAGSLKLLRRMADTGKAYVMVDLTGTIYGAFVIEEMDETESYFYINGVAQKVDFRITLKCVSDKQARSLLDDLQLPINMMDGSILDWAT